jgi:hypothetical protein
MIMSDQDCPVSATGTSNRSNAWGSGNGDWTPMGESDLPKIR